MLYLDPVISHIISTPAVECLAMLGRRNVPLVKLTEMSLIIDECGKTVRIGRTWMDKHYLIDRAYIIPGVRWRDPSTFILEER